MDEHTEGRLKYWSCESTGGCPQILALDDGERVAHVSLRRECEADARRLVACWNACEGISTEALEAGVVGNLCSELSALAEQYETWHDLGDAAAEPPDTGDARALLKQLEERP